MGQFNRHLQFCCQFRIVTNIQLRPPTRADVYLANVCLRLNRSPNAVAKGSLSRKSVCVSVFTGISFRIFTLRCRSATIQLALCCRHRHLMRMTSSGKTRSRMSGGTSPADIVRVRVIHHLETRASLLATMINIEATHLDQFPQTCRKIQQQSRLTRVAAIAQTRRPDSWRRPRIKHESRLGWYRQFTPPISTSESHDFTSLHRCWLALSELCPNDAQFQRHRNGAFCEALQQLAHAAASADKCALLQNKKSTQCRQWLVRRKLTAIPTPVLSDVLRHLRVGQRGRSTINPAGQRRTISTGKQRANRHDLKRCWRST